MSGKVMGAVWEVKLPHAEAWVLMAMADHADHIGDNVYPSIGLIAWKTGYSERQVQRIIKHLRDLNILVPVREELGKVNVYRIDLRAAKMKQPYGSDQRQNVTPDKMSPLTKQAQTPDKMSPTPDIAMSPEPSLTYEPSYDVHAARPFTGNPELATVAAAGNQDTISRLIDLGISRGPAITIAKNERFAAHLTPDTCAQLKTWIDMPRKGNPVAILTACLKDGKLPDDLPPPPKPKECTGIVDGVVVDRAAYDRYVTQRKRDLGYA